MTYKIYTSDAFVVKTRPSKDTDLSLLLFTEQLGLLNAIAKSARQHTSKLKFALQSLSFSSISLVKGREVWRITSVKKHISLYDKRLVPEVRAMLARILLFVERFCPREQPEPEVFDLVKQISGFVFKEIATSPELPFYIQPIEYYFMINMLYHLGYVKNVEAIESMIDTKISIDIVKALLDPMLSHQVEKIIEKGMAESHL